MGEWYYVGHYGQLGPLTREQVDELVEGGVIAADTYVWRTGMAEWLPATQVPELAPSLRATQSFAPPPPPPAARRNAPPPNPQGAIVRPTEQTLALGVSDKSRIAAGILQLFLPGIGRIYLGYAAIGVLQLVLSLCGVGYVWSFIDGLIMLSNGLRIDGYGRALRD